MYDECYFCLDQLSKLKKESTASFFCKFWRSRGTKEPAYITVFLILVWILHLQKEKDKVAVQRTPPEYQGLVDVYVAGSRASESLESQILNTSLRSKYT